MSSEDIATDVSQHEASVQQSPAQPERTLTQEDVDRAVQARLAREREKMSMGGNQSQPAFDRDALLQEAAQMMQKQMDEQRQAYEREQEKAQIEEIARTYSEKMAQGKDLYDDFEEVTSDFSPAAYPQITIMASQYDNLPDIMYELTKNPRKLVDLHVLAMTHPALAKKEMAKLSNSIKQNEQALVNNQKSPAPMSRLKPSRVAGQDTGKLSIKDLRKQDRFKV
jgi:hypothetical protein